MKENRYVREKLDQVRKDEHERAVRTQEAIQTYHEKSNPLFEEQAALYAQYKEEIERKKIKNAQKTWEKITEIREKIANL